jgi:hypothetical protein
MRRNWPGIGGEFHLNGDYTTISEGGIGRESAASSTPATLIRLLVREGLAGNRRRVPPRTTIRLLVRGFEAHGRRPVEKWHAKKIALRIFNKIGTSKGVEKPLMRGRQRLIFWLESEIENSLRR